MATKLGHSTSNEFGFWTPVKYGDQATSFGQKSLECIDSYFHLKGRVAVVVPGVMEKGSTGVKLQEGNTELWLTVLKVVSYATVIIPTIMLLAKWILRTIYPFHTCARVLPNGTEEIGAFVNGVLQQGVRKENEQTIYVSPKLLLGEINREQEGIELNFAEIDGRAIPVQRPYRKGEYNRIEEYTRYLGSASEALFKMAQDTSEHCIYYGDRHNGSPIKFILQLLHYDRGNMFLFLTSLITPNEQNELPIHTVNVASLLEILELARENNLVIEGATIDFLFNKWATEGRVTLLQALLAIRPEAIRQTIGREPSYFSEAVLLARHARGQFFLQAMQAQNIALTPADQWIQKAIDNDCNFTNEEWLAQPVELRRKIFQVANKYVNKEFVQKLRDLGMLEQPVEPKGAALFSCNMDAIHVEQTLLGFLRDLYIKGRLLTAEAFAKKDRTQYYHKHNDVARILGRDYIERTAQRLQLPFVKVPRKTAVIHPVEPDRHSIDFTVFNAPSTENLQIYAERITPIERRATRAEMLGLLDLVEEIGFNNFLGDNLMMGKNWDGEEGIYFIDTEYHKFSSLPHHHSMGNLRRLMAPEDHQWLQEEIIRRRDLFEPQRAAKAEALEQEWEAERAVALEHGFLDRAKPFTFAIADLIPQVVPAPQAVVNS